LADSKPLTTDIFQRMNLGINRIVPWIATFGLGNWEVWMSADSISQMN